MIDLISFWLENVISSAYREYFDSYALANAFNLASSFKQEILEIYGLAGEPCGNFPPKVHNFASTKDTSFVYP
ncbi:hypothetical protein SDC9_97324 [bioreactor metagenome]|uniref:Uncharacterized protein n=1 Tax=bioreactor metagenome TaxID=1076179 RepID=A0A645ABK0_9ZZZZ